jgi:uncharacterized OB-fold protein
MPPELEILTFPGEGPAAPLLPAREADTAPYYEALDGGRLALQKCDGCGRHRYPIAPACPHCCAAEHTWETVDGTGTIHGWVRYHRPFLSAFELLVPYIVLSVELDAGPRLFGRLVDADEPPRPGEPATMVLERWGDGCLVPAFRTGPAEVG